MEPIGNTEAATSAGKPQVTVKRSLLLIGDISLFDQRFRPDYCQIGAIFLLQALRHAFPGTRQEPAGCVAGIATDERSGAPIGAGNAFPVTRGGRKLAILRIRFGGFALSARAAYCLSKGTYCWYCFGT
jgi:hypothetical protein